MDIGLLPEATEEEEEADGEEDELGPANAESVDDIVDAIVFVIDTLLFETA
jgi:hypothetical protein